jgi:NmrA-like family protein
LKLRFLYSRIDGTRKRVKVASTCSDALLLQQGKGIDMLSDGERLIAVIGATGQQGGAVVRALQASSQFKVRALSRSPDKHRDLADEVVRADLNLPESCI